MDKRPKDMTLEELDALPDGPMQFDRVLIDTPKLQKKYGLPLGHTLNIPRMARMGALSMMPDDIAFAVLSDGVYSFGRFEDGSWFKRRV